MFAVAVWLYASTTRPRDRAGRYSFWAFVAFAAISYTSNAFGPPPPSAAFLAWFSLGVWLFPMWAWWFDTHRTPVNGKTTAPGEIRAETATGAEKKTLAPGDILNIPAGMPHQFLVPAGKQVTYFAMKVPAK